MIKPYYEDEAVTIYHADCLDVLPSLSDIHLTVTSPPYDDIRTYEGYEFDWRKTMRGLSEVTAKGGVVVWNVADQTINGSETGTSFRQALYMMDECRMYLHDTMIYMKTGVTFPDANRYLPAFEYMFVFSKGKPNVFNGLKDRQNVSAGSDIHSTDRNRDGSMSLKSRQGAIIPEYGLRYNWWYISNPYRRGDPDHPARMPYKMAADHIATWSKKGDTVLDPLAGSGTVLRAAKDLGRKAIGIEIEEKYCEIAANRMSQMVMAL